MRINMLAVLLMSFVSLNPAWAQDKVENLTVHDAWVRWQPPSRPNSAAFMTIENNTEKQMALVSVAAHSVETVELHTMEHVDGVMNMQQVQRIDIPAKSPVELKPGGHHLMLFGIQKPLEPGEKVPLTLNFEDGSVVEVEAVVKGQDEE